jgi:hypothetical protein
MFSETFRRTLEGGKYTSWASQLDPDQLYGLLWALGEYGYRTAADSQELRQILDSAAKAGLHPRAHAGLRMALQFAAGDTRTIGEVQDEIRIAMRRDAAR